MKQDILLGDVNGDGAVTASDAQIVLSAYAEELADNPHGLTEAQLAAADVDGNNKLSAIDAQYILVYFLMNSVLDNPTDWSELVA